MAATTRPTQRLLLLEIALILLLIGLSTVMYLRPASQGLVQSPWWRWVTLGALFFAAVGIHTWRSRHRSHAELHRVIREDAATHGDRV